METIGILAEGLNTPITALLGMTEPELYDWIPIHNQIHEKRK